MSTASAPESARKVCRNVYQPDVVTRSGARQLFDPVEGAGQGFCGNAPLRNAFGLALMYPPDGSAGMGRAVPALNTKSRRNVPVALLIAELKSNRASACVAAHATSRYTLTYVRYPPTGNVW